MRLFLASVLYKKWLLKKREKKGVREKQVEDREV